MTLTLAVCNLPNRPELFQYYKKPLHVSGNLLLDSSGARLYDWNNEVSVLLADPEACAAIRAALPPPGEYLGGAILHAWVREGPDGAELHTVYRVILGDLQRELSVGGTELVVRPVPPEHQYIERGTA
jgi:hypothetical protein